MSTAVLEFGRHTVWVHTETLRDVLPDALMVRGHATEVTVSEAKEQKSVWYNSDIRVGYFLFSGRGDHQRLIASARTKETVDIVRDSLEFVQRGTFYLVSTVDRPADF